MHTENEKVPTMTLHVVRTNSSGNEREDVVEINIKIGKMLNNELFINNFCVIVLSEWKYSMSMIMLK